MAATHLPLNGRRAFVTGGASGIGAAIVRRLSADGAQVVIADLDLAGAEVLARQVGADVAMAVALDVTDLERVAQVMADLANTQGSFDILVNNAGLDQHASFTNTTAHDWRRLLAVGDCIAFSAISPLLALLGVVMAPRLMG